MTHLPEIRAIGKLKSYRNKTDSGLVDCRLLISPQQEADQLHRNSSKPISIHQCVSASVLLPTTKYYLLYTRRGMNDTKERYEQLRRSKRSSQTYQLVAFRSSYFSADHRSPVVSSRISSKISLFTKTDCAAVALNKKSRPSGKQSRSTAFIFSFRFETYSFLFQGTRTFSSCRFTLDRRLRCSYTLPQADKLGGCGVKLKIIRVLHADNG